MPAADVEAIVQGAGQGTRLGLGPKAFVVLGGHTLLERVVTTMLTVAARVSVAVPPADRAHAERLVGGPRVNIIAGGTRRIDTFRLLVGAATAPWLLLHEVVRPFTTSELSQQVIDEARRSGAAAAVLRNVDFLIGTDGQLRASPGEVMAVQKPVAFRRADIERGFECAERAAAGGLVPDAGVVEILAFGGRKVAFVPGHAMNFKLTTLDDFEWARRLVAPD